MLKRRAFDGLRILLVEDDILIAMDMEDLLIDLGCEVIGPFARLEPALQAAADTQLDGALLDLNLQGELSFPVINTLNDRDIPLIVCSGYVELPQLRERLHDIPTLGKPCDHSKLVDLMRRVFTNESTVAARADRPQSGIGSA